MINVKMRIIIDLDVVTVAEWDSQEDAIKFINRIKEGEFTLFTPYILMEHLSKWEHKNLVAKIEHFYKIYSKIIISAQNVLDKLNELEIDRVALIGNLIRAGVKEEDAVLVLAAGIFEIDFLVTFNRKHLKGKESEINKVLKKNGIKNIRICLPGEI